MKAQHALPAGALPGHIKLLPWKTQISQIQGLLWVQNSMELEKRSCFSETLQRCHNPGMMSKLLQG